MAQFQMLGALRTQSQYLASLALRNPLLIIMKRNKGSFLVNLPEFSFLKDLGLEEHNPAVYDGNWKGSGEIISSVDPGTGHTIAKVQMGTAEELNQAIRIGTDAFKEWSKIGPPVRGEIVRQIGQELRKFKEPLGKLIGLEVGKIFTEGQGEVQEFIDICDYAVGLSRIYSGRVINSEREQHTILETWRPIGLTGIISAYNFPNAVFGWNAAIALVTGNSVLWKGAPSTSLVSIATMKIIAEILKRNDLPPIATLCQGGIEIGEKIVEDDRVKLVSFTGSCEVGRNVGGKVQRRFGRVILELGGNNALIIDEDADLQMAVEAALFGCIGTSGQRCTSIRRIIVHENVYDKFIDILVQSYKQIMPKIGHPLDPETLVGPVHAKTNVNSYKNAVSEALASGGKIAFGGKIINRDGFFVEPTIITNLAPHADIVQRETFAPIVYVLKTKSLEEAISWNNDVVQGLSSAIFTKDISKMFKWIGNEGSDCGIINVNTTTNGAEIGGAFGGEKNTGGGRESGSDSWKQYCRRATITINHSGKLACAQGVVFQI